MTFELYLAGLLENETERAQAFQIVADFHARYKDSPDPVEVIVGPRLGESLPDLLVNFRGVPILLELKGVYDRFRLKASNPEAPTSAVVWDDPTTFLLGEFARTFRPGEQAIRFRSEFLTLLKEVRSGNTQGTLETGSPSAPYSWIVVQPGNSSSVLASPPDGFPWLDIVPINLLSDRCNALEPSAALPSQLWNGIHQQLGTQRAHVGGWPKEMDKRYRSAEPSKEGRPAHSSAADFPSENHLATIGEIAEKGLKDYAPWLADLTRSKKPAIREAALKVLIQWNSDLAGGALVSDLEGRDARLRARAIDSLSRIRCDAATPLLRSLIHREDVDLAGVLDALIHNASSDAYPDVVALARDLVHSRTTLEDNRWRIVIKALGRFAGDLPAKELIGLYQEVSSAPTNYPHSSPDTRREEILWELGTNTSCQAGYFLTARLKDDPETFDSALRALTRGPHPEAVQALRPILYGESDSHREMAVFALSKTRSTAARNLLLGRLERSLRNQRKDPSEDDLGWRIGLQLEEWAKQALEHRLCKLIDSGEALNRDRTLNILASVVSNASAETLWRLIPDLRYSERAAWMLQHLGGARILERAVELLGNRNPVLIAAGVRICARMEDPPIASKVQELETHGSFSVRLAVAEAYQAQGTPYSRRRALRMVTDPDEATRQIAITTVQGELASHARGCRLTVVKGPEVVGQLCVSDACIMLLDREQREAVWTIPLDTVRSHALWSEEEQELGVWLSLEGSFGHQNVVLTPTADPRSIWRESIARQWYPPIEAVLPLSKRACEGDEWNQVRRLLPDVRLATPDQQEQPR